MYSTQGDYNSNFCNDNNFFSHSLNTKFPARKNKSICNNMQNNILPKEYIENEDKKILCKYIKDHNLNIYHPVCSIEK